MFMFMTPMVNGLFLKVFYKSLNMCSVAINPSKPAEAYMRL